MDVDSTNFTQSLVSEIASLLQSASFFSLDLEMTGISGPLDPQRAAASSDTIPLRYAKSRLVAKQFGIIQFGLSIFSANNQASSGASAGLTAKTYNFYVFPRPVTEGGGNIRHIPTIGLCSSGINFARQNGMDFQRWIDRGVSFVDAAVERQLVENADEDIWGKYYSSTPVEAVFAERPDLYDSYVQELEKINSFANEMSQEATNYKVANLRSMQMLKCLLTQVHAEHPDLMLYEESSGAATDRFLTKRSRNDLLMSRIGFRQIWKLLTNAAIPLVVHNGLLDLLFCVQWFEEELPADVVSFKKKLIALFPSGIYDTRLLAIECGVDVTQASLEGLVEIFQHEPDFATISLDSISAHKYHAHGILLFHEAGYDALSTGRIFACLKSQAHKFKNQLCVARCFWAFCTDATSAGGDRVLQEGGKFKLVKFMSGAPANVRDLLTVFDDLKTPFMSLAVDLVPNGDYGLLILTWAETDASDRDQFVLALNSRIAECVKSGVKNYPALRMLTQDEYVRKQLDFVDNNFQDENIEIALATKRLRRAMNENTETPLLL